MKKDCTRLFIQYREVARLVWNTGFWPQPELRVWACERSYDEAITRLYEGMILIPLGFEKRVDLTFCPGGVVPFSVTANHSGIQLLVNGNPPDHPARLWGNPAVTLAERPYKLRFIAFFDWDQLAVRDFALLKVLIEQLDGMPDLVGRHAIVEFAACSIWLDEHMSADGDDSMLTVPSTGSA